MRSHRCDVASVQRIAGGVVLNFGTRAGSATSPAAVSTTLSCRVALGETEAGHLGALLDRLIADHESRYGDRR